ncbi:putative methylcrotonoyl-CoA carboxylase beta chain, mitochondrial [Orchesella cincta]|uniref:methylcrotonoyl-CoA carboxylase n=1 Tax=Orchesella cincta TaxID=48709 RepID=A0A1D2NED8_ORCCI|nr:putative methylcrotonoyl-CoA carboxylase beta chain, mitochondrial [Orchesella cincta]
MFPRSRRIFLEFMIPGFRGFSRWVPLSQKSLTTGSSKVSGYARRIPGFEEERDDILKVPTTSQAKSALERYYELQERSWAGGGPRGIERHVQKNRKVLIRDRIQSLLDPGSPFLEIGDLAGYDMMYGDVPAAGVVVGIGKIQGVFCMISGNDATVKAGTYYPITVTKSYRCQEISRTLRLPTVYMPDSGGAFLPLQSEIFPDKKHGGSGFYNQALMSSEGIHQIALVCGSCTAGGAYNPTMCDEAIIVDRIGKIFLGGPPLVKAATGEIVTDEDLGGAFLHSSVSGCTDYFAHDEEEAFSICRDIVYSLNMTTNSENVPFEEPTPSLPWKDVAESKDYFSKLDLYVILSGILDGSKFHEFKSYYGQNAIAGMGCLEGRRIGIVANVGNVGPKEALKLSHFVNSCSRRSIPILFLQNSLMDETGCEEQSYLTDNDEIDTTVLKCRAALASAIATSTVPKIGITLSGLSQDGCLTMCGPAFQPSFHFMWPQAKLADLEMVKSTDNPVFLDSFYAAANMITDAIVAPSETRSVVSLVLQILEQMKLNPPPTVATGVIRM